MSWFQDIIDSFTAAFIEKDRYLAYFEGFKIHYIK